MNEPQAAIAQKCLAAAYEDAMDFPAIVRALMDAGFESYLVDYRQGTSTYFLASGESLQLRLPQSGAPIPIAADFDARSVEQAVRDAQNKVPGYTYASFCSKVKSAGCAGYIVSFLGRRVVYFGRTAETHIEHFPR